MRAVLERDFLFEASRPRAIVLRTVLAAVVAATVLLLFYEGTRDASFDPDQVGLEVFRAGASSLLALLALLTPPLVVGSILAERQQDTLPLVLASPVGARNFAFAKLLSRSAVALTVALAALPCLSLTVLYGGVAGRHVLGLGVLSLATVLELAAWSVWISSVSRRLATAAVLSFVLPLVRWVATGFCIGWILRASLRDDSAASPVALDSAILLIDTTPFGPFLELMVPGALTDMPGMGGAPPPPHLAFLCRHPWFPYLAFSLLAATAAVLAAGKRLERESEPRQGWIVRSARARRWFRGLPAKGNPVAWKERRLLNTASSRPLFYGVMGVLALATLLGAPALAEDVSSFALLVGETTLLSLVALVQGAASLGHERTQGGWDLLRGSLLTADELLRGKVAGLVLGIVFLAAIPVCQLVIALVMRAIEPRSAAAAAVLLFLGPLFWGLLGLRLGASGARIRTCVVRACSLFAVFLVGLPLLATVLMIFEHDSDAAASWLVSASPPVAQFFVLSAVERGTMELDFTGSDPRPQGFVWCALLGAAAMTLRVVLPGAFARRMEEDRETG